MRLSLDDLKFLDNEKKTEYMVLERLFDQPGWKVVVAHAQQWFEMSQKRAAFAKTWDENRLAIGAAAVYNQFANLEDITNAEYENLVQEAKTAQQEDDEQENE